MEPDQDIEVWLFPCTFGERRYVVWQNHNGESLVQLVTAEAILHTIQHGMAIGYLVAHTVN